MKILGNEIKPGMIIEHKNDLWSVLKAQHVKPGKGGAFNQVELKSVKKGTKLNERFRSSDTIERAILDDKKLPSKDIKGGFIIIADIGPLEKICRGIFFEVENQGICMIEKRNE